MRYADSHKEETRNKVVKAAAAAVRAKGPDGVGVAEIMKEVGLTHGGFYAHFPSKEALVAAAIGEAFDQGHRRFGRIIGDKTGLEAFDAFLQSYVSMDHRAHPQRGCPIATIASDLPRQGAAVREVFDAGVTSLIGRVASWLPGDDAQERQDLAGSLLAEMAGAVSLSRAVSDEAMARRFLDQSRKRIAARAGVSA
jgi:TetR/AcrR family transcriptional regulator, transcriptional repressor for nem operon